MRSWGPARARRLDELAGPDGVIVGAAVDHRDSLRVALAKVGRAPTDEGLSELKLAIAKALSGAATVVLLDAEYSAAQALAAGVLPGDVALAVALEAQGYGDLDEKTETTFLENWTAGDAARLGASACKLLLPFRADIEVQAHRQEAVVREAVAACDRAGVALVLEPIVYDVSDPGRFAELVVAGAERLAGLSPDILKVQYPGSADACRALDAACGPAVPWVLLGGGADESILGAQIADACQAGASGFIVGRTLWNNVVRLEDPIARTTELYATSVPLLQRLATVARECATPWRSRVGVIAAPAAGTLPV